MSAESDLQRWRGKVDSDMEAHSDYHEKHFNAIDDLKISLTEIKTRVTIFATMGAAIGSLLAYLIVSLINHTLPIK